MTGHLCLRHLSYGIIYQGIYENVNSFKSKLKTFLLRKHFIIDKVFIVIHSLIKFK